MNRKPDVMRTFPAAQGEQVTLANLLSGPYNRWAFRNMRRLLPTANVWRGNGPAPVPLVEPVHLGDVEFLDRDGAPHTVAENIVDGYTDGLVILHRGKIVTEYYAEGVEPHEPHLLMSVTKSFAGSLAGILVEQGRLKPDDRVTDIVPEVKGSAYDGALVHHVLNMTVGIDFDDDYDNPDSDNVLLDVASGWRPPRDGAPDNLRDYITTMRPAGEHGSTFHYVSTNTDLLGWILERVSGTDFATLLSREVWQPMGAAHDAYVTLDRLGAPQTDGGLCVTTRDLARFGQLHLQNGIMNGRRIVPEWWIRDFRDNGDADAWDRGSFADLFPGCHYRYQWFTDLKCERRPFFGIGIHGQMLFVDSVAGVVGARHSSHPMPVDDKYLDDMERAFGAVADILQ